MSVLIKGIEMPKTCTMCWLSPICPVWVKEVSRYKGYDNRLPNCPLVEVPTPHGQLIDADALMHEFAEFVRASNNSDFADVPTWNDAVSLLGSAPAIIEAEEGAEDE